MKRVLLVALGLMVAGSALAQGTFTIRRPADGARVREVVDVRIPKNSIPDGGYLGIVINGKFLEAVMPEVDGDDYVYKLDTKGREIPDGELSIETILYMYSNSNPVVLDRSRVTVNLDNRTSIAVPDEGVALRYKFNPGSELVYKLTSRATISTVTQAQAQLGSRGREIPLDEETIRVLWATDNAYRTANGRDGLVRIQVLPDEDKGYVWATPGGATQPIVVMADQMLSMYHRLSDTGREQFSSLPDYFPLEGTAGIRRATTDYYLVYPFPILPTKEVVPGDVWQAAINLGSVPEEDITGDQEDQFFQALPGRGVFEGVEWHRGIPCAKLSMNIQVGAADLQNARNINNLPGEAQNIQVNQVVWFALDRGVIVRQERNIVQESLVEVQTAGGGGLGGPGGGPAGAPGRGGLGSPPGGPQGGPAAGGPGGVPGRGGRFNLPNGGGLVGSTFSPNVLNQAWGMFQSAPGGIPGGPPGGAPGGGPFGGPQDGFGRGPGAGTGGSVSVKVIQKVTVQTIFELESP